jgi:hypothetical protein
VLRHEAPGLLAGAVGRLERLADAALARIEGRDDRREELLPEDEEQTMAKARRPQTLVLK